jgi:hypothetical protein
MPSRITPTLAVIFLMALALMASGCTNPLGDPKPSVTLTAHYVPPSPTPSPSPSPTPVPSPSTSWNGIYVKLYGNVSASGGDHVYGTVKIYYLDKNYWDEHPTAQYDTDECGNYSLDVRANVSFIPEFGYFYFDRIPMEMYTRRLDNMTIQADTRLDYNVMTSNITPIK